MFITPSLKKSLIVEQFQGNYLNYVSILSDVILCYRKKMLVSYLHSSTQINIMSPFVRFVLFSFSNFNYIQFNFVLAYGTQELYAPVKVNPDPPHPWI